MSDLVKRLREAEWIIGSRKLLDKEAADRIERLEAVLVQAREAMKLAVSANNFRAACIASNSDAEKVQYAEKVFWMAMDDLSAIAAIDAALKE